MAELPSSFDTQILPSAPSSSSGASDDSFDDACSICLEPFTTDDPATVTNCKHEYHLQCIVEWSQRSKECPICWQILSLSDPTSQELLSAVESERSIRANHITISNVEFEDEQDASYADDSDFNERIMQHLAAAARRARFMGRRERHSSSVFGVTQGLIFGPAANAPETQQAFSSLEDYQSSDSGSSEDDSPTSGNPISTNSRVVNMISSTDANREAPVRSRVQGPPPSDSTKQPSASELLSLSDSIKSKFSAASSRYKESISKGTRGLREKLVARNNTVKELSKGVQREMSAGIAGVARMIERLDPMSKRNGVSVSAPAPGCNRSTSNLSSRGKGVLESVIESFEAKNGKIAQELSADAPSHVCATIPGRVEISHADVWMNGR